MYPTRAALRYPGGKWKLAPWVIEHFPAHDVYVEPFCGGASVLLQKDRARRGEVINDIDGEIVNFFSVLRDKEAAAELIRRIELTPFARDEFHAALGPSGDSIEDARRLAVRAYMGQGSCVNYQNNGLRSKRTGQKFPARDWQLYPASLAAVVERLQGVVIENLPALEIINRYDHPGTLFYCDPPYVHSTRLDCGHKHYRYEMNDEDHIALARSLRKIQGMAVVSGYPSELYRDLYRGWQKYERPHHKDRGGESVECLWISPKCGTVQRKLFEGSGGE